MSVLRIILIVWRPGGHLPGNGLYWDYARLLRELCAIKKMRGHLGKKLHGNREIAVVRAVGVWVQPFWQKSGKQWAPQI